MLFVKKYVVKESDWTLPQVNFVIVLDRGQYVGKRGCYVSGATSLLSHLG